MQNRSSWPIFLSLLLVLLFDYYTFLHYGGHNTRQFFFYVKASRYGDSFNEKGENWERECRFYILLFALSFSRWLRTFHKKRLPNTRLVPFFFSFYFAYSDPFSPSCTADDARVKWSRRWMSVVWAGSNYIHILIILRLAIWASLIFLLQ
jgi:hypothetical protein